MSNVFKGIGKIFGGVVGGLLGLNPTKMPKPLPTAQRDDAMAQVENEDELRRRRGAAADMLTGSGGAEAAIGSIGKFNPNGN